MKQTICIVKYLVLSQLENSVKDFIEPRQNYVQSDHDIITFDICIDSNYMYTVLDGLNLVKY
jgi:hypothetical protein